MSRDVDRYAALARTLVREGDVLRAKGISGRYSDMTLSPARFLELLAEVWDEAFDAGVRREGDRPMNPYRYPEEER